MALDYKDRYKERVATTFEYPFGKAINASSDTSDDGTPFEQDYINDQWGFFQKLLVDTGQTPNGVVDTANTSQYVDALKIMFREPLGENVFIAINRGFLAKITFYPVGGSGSIYKVFDANTNQPVDIYANKEGSVLIPQNDINNVASPEGDIIFFISEGDYYITINTQKIEFSVVSNLSSVSNQIVDIGDDVSTIRGDLNDTINDILDLKNYNEREGAKVGSTLYSLYTKNEDVDQALFYTELKLLEQRKRDLDIGDSVAIVDNRLTTVADDQGALAQEVLQLTAATGVIGGQVTATVSRVNQAETDISGNAQAISALTTSVENTIGDLSDAQLILDSTVDELGVVSSRAYLGVSNTVGGKTTVTGITADSETNGLRFQGDVIQFDDTLGNPALQYRADLNKWSFNGQLVVGGYTIDSEADIRGLDGAGFYGSTYTTIAWDTTTANSRFTTLVGRPPVNGDIFTQTRTDGTDSQARQYNGSSWVAVTLQVNGSIVASGTIAGDKLIAGTEITAPRIVGGEIITNTGTGTRGEYYDDGTYLQWLGSGAKTDANGVFWIKRDGTGFIKGDFFQGEIIATVSATNSANASTLTATSGSYVSAGKPVSINFSQTLTVTVQGDTHASQDFSCTILIKRGTTTIKSVTVQPSRFNYPPSDGGQPGDLDTEAVYDISSFLVDNTTATGSRTYTIESQSTASPTSPYTYYNDHEVSLYAQENKLA